MYFYIELGFFILFKKSEYRNRVKVQLEKIFPDSMISSLPIDSMHTISGGTCKDFLTRIIDTSRQGPMTRVGMGIVDSRFQQMKPCFVKEFARSLRFVCLRSLINCIHSLSTFFILDGVPVS